jgi:hypothetical protein
LRTFVPVDYLPSVTGPTPERRPGHDIHGFKAVFVQTEEALAQMEAATLLVGPEKPWYSEHKVDIVKFIEDLPAEVLFPEDEAEWVTYSYVTGGEEVLVDGLTETEMRELLRREFKEWPRKWVADPRQIDAFFADTLAGDHLIAGPSGKRTVRTEVPLGYCSAWQPRQAPGRGVPSSQPCIAKTLRLDSPKHNPLSRASCCMISNQCLSSGRGMLPYTRRISGSISSVSEVVVAALCKSRPIRNLITSFKINSLSLTENSFRRR